MEFNIIIGNPPYNHNMYIDFVQAGYQILKDDGAMVMITPAKWQAKGGKKNEDFRANIVPHMKEIIYWPDCVDVFGISELGGITTFCIDKETHDIKSITNISNLALLINSTENRDMNYDTLWNVGYSIVKKIRAAEDYKPYTLKDIPSSEMKGYTINVNKQSPTELSAIWDWNRSCIDEKYIGKGGCLFNIHDGKTALFGRPKINKNGSGTSIFVFTSNDKEEARSFLSWFYSNFVRFLVMIALCSNSIMNENTWRFVPDPGAFDHIFTDQELYEKYGLTDDEKAIIESVIKERK